MKKIIIILFLTWTCSFLYGQGVNTDYYKYGASPSNLPGFLIDSAKHQALYFGISDPDLDSVQAIKQGLNRAESLLFLSRNARVRSLFDYYVGEEYSGSGGTFQSFVQLSVNDSIFPDYTVVDTFFTRFNEAIVRIQPNESSEIVGFTIGKSYDIIIEKFRMEYEWGGSAEFQDQTEMHIHLIEKVESSEILSIYQYLHQFEVVSTVNGIERFFPTLRYNYVQPDKEQQQYFKYGLWVHIMDKLIQEIATESRRIRETVKKTGETYKTNTALRQGLTSNLLTFRIQRISLNGGEVNMDVSVELIDL